MLRRIKSDALVVRHQQSPGRGAHEDLDAAATGKPLQFAEERGVVVRPADVKGVVGVHAALGADQLVGQGVGVGGGGLGVRHLEHGGDAAQHRAARTALEVFLPLQTGLAEVDLAVDHARHHGEAGGVEHLARVGVAQVADEGDLAVPDADVGEGRVRRG